MGSGVDSPEDELRGWIVAWLGGKKKDRGGWDMTGCLKQTDMREWERGGNSRHMAQPMKCFLYGDVPPGVVDCVVSSARRRMRGRKHIANMIPRRAKLDNEDRGSADNPPVIGTSPVTAEGGQAELASRFPARRKGKPRIMRFRIYVSGWIGWGRAGSGWT